MSKRHRFFAATALVLFAAGVAVQAAPADQPDIEKILKSVSPSVVRVEARNGVRKVATGVVIDKDGTIVTTALISPRDEKIMVLTFEGKSHEADFKGFDTSTGLAVIQVKDKGLPAVPLAKSGEARPGAWAGAIGFSPENTPSVTQGIVSSTTEDRIRLNLWVMPGSSGSPVVGADGQLIGVLRGTYVTEQPIVFEFDDKQITGSGTVISWAEAPSSGMALAVPVDVVLSIAGDIKKNGKVRRGWIGVLVGEQDGRLEIAEIDAKSPAELAKLKVGDVIIKFDGRDISTGEQFSREIRKRKPGTEIILGLKRDGADKDVKVKLGEYTEEDSRRELESRFPGLFPQWKPGQKLPPPDRTIEQFFTMGNRKYIGVTLQELTKDLAAYFGAKDGYGLLVTEFAPDSPSQKAGMKIGDVLLKADGRALQSIVDLTDLLDQKKKDERIKLEILRDKKALTLEVPVAEDTNRPPDADAAYRALREFQNSLGSGNRLAGVRDKLTSMTEDMAASGSASKKKISRMTARSGVYYRI